MRSQLGNECRKLFRKMMATQFPEYQQDKGQIVPQGCYVWTRHSSGLWFHIFLLLDPTRDKFVIEGAWSVNGKMKLFAVWGLEEFMSEPNRIRIGNLWDDVEFWWSLFPDPERPRSIREMLLKEPLERCLPLVAPAVADAAQKLRQYFVPLFEKIAEKHGKKSP